MSVAFTPAELRKLAADPRQPATTRAHLLATAQRLDGAGKGRRGGPRGTRNARCDLPTHVHESKTEARVCCALRSELCGQPVLVFVAARLPVWALGPEPNGKPAYVSIDFAVVDPVTFKVLRLVDAKPEKRDAVSRDWHRGRLALERTYEVRVEERSK